MKISLRKGSAADIEQVIALLHEVKNGMGSGEWFFLDPDDEIRQMMEEGVMELWAAEADGKLAGIFTILHPGLESFNYGYDLDFDEELLMRVVQMDTAAVLPDYRGQGLQKRLMETAEAEIRKHPGRILLCTIHPDNRFSLANVLKQNYRIEKTVEKYGSVRHVLRKDLT